MDSLIFTLVSFVVALAILIAVHEFGHFWVARKLGVKVLRFSIGFGKTLWRYRESADNKSSSKGDGTEYVIAAIPLGGYVKMLDEREAEVPKDELHRAFNRQTIPVRSAIVAAGPIFNFLFAIIAFWVIFVAGDTGTRAIIGGVETGSLAESAGFQSGDEIAYIGDRHAPTWEIAIYAFLSESGSSGALDIRVTDVTGNAQVRSLPSADLAQLIETGDLLRSIGFQPQRPTIPPVLGQVLPGEPAANAGLVEGDRILKVDGQIVESWTDFVTYIRKKAGISVEVEIDREGQNQYVDLTVGKQVVDGEVIGRIGAGVSVPESLYDEYRTEIQYGPVEAVSASVAKTWDMSVFLVKMVGRMITGQASVKNLSGPISIAQTAGKSASYGFIYFIKFLALVSISLGVLNLLPIPVLDGGHLFFFLIEAIKGSPLSEEAMLLGQKIGMLLLLALMVLAFYVDIERLLG